MIIKCIAIDDEPPALKQIENYISKVPFLDLIKTFYNGIEPLSYLRENEIDLIFLDIEMEDLTGIQFLKTLKKQPKVILTTAYDSYAIEAFDLQVTDYLLKPISFERFLQAVDTVYDLMISRSSKEHSPKAPEYRRDYIFLKTEYKIQRVDLDTILYIEGMKEYLRIHTTVGNIMTLQTMKRMEELLPDAFIRVHKSYMVSLSKIERIERNRIKIHEALIPISNTYRKVFFDVLEERKLI